MTTQSKNNTKWHSKAWSSYNASLAQSHSHYSLKNMMKSAMARPRKLKRTLTTIFHKRKKRADGDTATVSSSGREALSESTLSRASRSSIEYQRCCFPSWQHICHSRSPALSLESSQTATASERNDGNSLELIMEVQSNSGIDRVVPHANTPVLTDPGSTSNQTVCSTLFHTDSPRTLITFPHTPIAFQTLNATPVSQVSEPLKETPWKARAECIDSWECRLSGSVQKQGRLFLTPSALLFQGILLNCEPKVWYINTASPTHDTCSSCYRSWCDR